ncbi:beta-lactamase family protein [Muricauda sp. 2012CJ35-5]|uniref:Beta-lactamase family protein n=1 Tax=Flagellimonas spongiicola TaxID=2942208 RepID=A0ABT0PVP4_9FLAO|nr:serine hydrolase domain-containing protein [Allomuricauda spongiicola]MCL6275462.1 beta-lactamase family protein [Allomuricauda spongiicola]
MKRTVKTNQIRTSEKNKTVSLKFLLCNVVLVLLLYATGWSQESHSKGGTYQKSLADFVTKKMKKHHIVGANVTYVRNNEVILNQGFGYADLENQVPTNVNTTYPIGSVSKVVTSTAVLKLYSDGVIDIDRKYTDYVPDFAMKKHFDGPIDFTVRHLLAHYAGLPRVRGKGFLKHSDRPLDSLLADSRDEYLIAPAGKVYQYSDWGVDLLSLLVQRVSQKPFETYVEEEIFKPLQMKNSSYRALTTKGYMRGVETKTYEFSYPGSDGVYSTSADLAKLCSVYYSQNQKSGPEFIKPEIIKEALTHQFVDAPMAYDTQIGLMWEIRPLNGFSRVKKAGIHEPFYTYIFFVPEQNSAVIVCSNSNASSSFHWDVWSKAFSNMSSTLGLKGGQSPSKKERLTGKTTLSPSQMKELEGNYSTDLGILNLKANGKKFDATLGLDKQKGVATPMAGNLLKLAVKMMGIKIHAMDIFWDKIDNEIVVGEQYKSGNRNIGGAKIMADKIPDSWLKAAGNYSVINYETKDYKTIDKAELFVNDFGVLEMRVSLTYPSKTTFQLGLSPISENLAIVPGYNFEFFGGETIQLFNTNGTMEIKLSGYTLRKSNKS